MGAEPLGRFGHHPDAAIDFCIEIEEIETILCDSELGLRDWKSERLDERASTAFDFIPGADENAVAAKAALRGWHDRLLRLINPDALARRAGPNLLAAAEALGAMPEGYCFCSKDRIGDDSKVHEPECAAMRAAIAKARGL